MKIRALVFALALVLFAGALYAQEADPRIAEALDSADVIYTVKSSGNYYVEYKMDNNDERSHGVYVVSETETYRGIEIREIWAVAAVVYELPDMDTLVTLMETNSTIKVGAWAMEVSEDGEVWVLYTIKVPAELDGERLSTLIYFVAEMCDEFEEEYVGDDVY
mgnify:CR=1 FL=1